MLCALLFGLCACTPEAIQSPEPVLPLAAGAPQGNPEDVQEECSCQMSVQSISVENITSWFSWDLIDIPYQWRFSGGDLEHWGWYDYGQDPQQGTFPSPFFNIPPLTESEHLCDAFDFQLNGATDMTIFVKVRCFTNGILASEINDSFTFSQGTPIPGKFPENARRFYRQYICKYRTSDNPDPCKEAPAPAPWTE